MTIYLRRSTFSSGELTIQLRNDLGQLQDVDSITWTIESVHTGEAVSGLNMKAVRKSVGVYYAPWFANNLTGAYDIIWEYEVSGHSFKAAERFFIMDPDDAVGKDGHIKGLPPPDGYVFEPDTHVNGNDATLRLVDFAGYPQDAESVSWHIECLKGFPLTRRQVATHLCLGVYGIDWVVNLQGGEYRIRWEWTRFVGDPIQTVIAPFHVVDPNNVKHGVVPVRII